MSHLVLIPYYAGALFFWPTFQLFTRKPAPVSRSLRRVFLVTFLALGSVAVAVELIGDDQLWRIVLFPLINLSSLMFSIEACVGKGEAKLRFLQTPRLAAAAGIVFVVTAMMYLVGGFIKLDIMLHEARTTATVVGIGSHGVLKYQYEVDSHIYNGGGDPGNPPYPRGSTYEVRYSPAHPYFSSAQNPLTFFGQMLIACLFVGGGLFSMSRTASRRRAASAPQTNEKQSNESTTA